MTKWKRLKSILLKDGTKYAVNLQEWGEMTLEGDALAQHLAKIQEIGEFYQPQELAGDLIVESITENIEVNGAYIKLEVGSIFYFSDNFVVSPTEIDLWDKMSKDPNIIKYNPIHQIVED
jgi:hypothetical protein